MNPVTLTKATYFALPPSARKRHKDGSYWIALRSGAVGVPTTVTWLPVKWNS